MLLKQKIENIHKSKIINNTEIMYCDINGNIQSKVYLYSYFPYNGTSSYKIQTIYLGGIPHFKYLFKGLFNGMTRLGYSLNMYIHGPFSYGYLFSENRAIAMKSYEFIKEGKIRFSRN